jgi:hypothetical protein
LAAASRTVVEQRNERTVNPVDASRIYNDRLRNLAKQNRTAPTMRQRIHTGAMKKKGIAKKPRSISLKLGTIPSP